MRRLVIAVSGTPGTGKSTFSRILAERLRARLLRLNDLIEEHKIYSLDPDGTKSVDIPRLRRCFVKKLRELQGMVVVEGLLAHLLPKKVVDHVVVLRTRPKVLELRLRERKYPEKKIKENVDAEALDIILWEAVESHGIDKVHEIDTTDLTPEEAVEHFQRVLEGKAVARPGKIDWLEEHFKVT
ncbi:MAG: adenylate kinase family protein [Candidatus Hadarchaeum sp.]|uniref:adenylate kinase family protein n=1 Tax=Candidatus Hadarchaeum sp. TaxID=2883567 RepID=UPI003D1121D1